MRNATFCLLLVVLASWPNAVGQNGPKFTSPRIVATFERLGQTGEIPPTVIYTPEHWGTFRISLVMVLTSPNKLGSASWDGVIHFRDASGQNIAKDVLSTSVSNTATKEFPFRAKAGIPIKFSVSANGNTSGSRYNVWIVVEQLM
jgi:hypothetical protein